MASAFRQDIKAFIDATLSPQARSAILAKTAVDERTKLIASGQASQSYSTFVDGRRDPDETHVTGAGGGVIAYHFSSLADAAQFALAFLRTRVPRVTGLLSQSFWVSVNGTYYPPGATVNFKTVPANAEIVIGNTAAYWRRADANRRGNKSLAYRTPNELNDCAKAVSSQFGRAVVQVKRLNDYNFPNKYQPRRSPNRASYIYQSPVLVLTEAA